MLRPIAWQIPGRACDDNKPSDRRFGCCGLQVPVNDTLREPPEIAVATQVHSARTRDGRHQMTSTTLSLISMNLRLLLGNAWRNAGSCATLGEVLRDRQRGPRQALGY